MAFNAYLLFKTAGEPKIVGESTSIPEPAAEKAGAIEISEYGFGATMPVTASRSDGGGATVGRANFDVFTCSKSIDTSTTRLFQYCCLGTAIPKIVLHLYRQGNMSDTGVVKYAMVVFNHCVITKVAISGSGEELPKEQLEFNYGNCEYWYQKTKHDSGEADGNADHYGWSTITNKVADSGQPWGAFLPT